MDLDRKEHQKRKARLSESNVVELHLLVTGLLHAVFGKEHTAQVDSTPLSISSESCN